MKKNIQIFLEELYQNFPSLKQQEKKIIFFVEIFLKTKVDLLPDRVFKNRLKKQLLQQVARSCTHKQNFFWKNVILFLSLTCMGLASYGVFSLYYIQIFGLDPDQRISPLQKEVSQSDISLSLPSKNFPPHSSVSSSQNLQNEDSKEKDPSKNSFSPGAPQKNILEASSSLKTEEAISSLGDFFVPIVQNDAIVPISQDVPDDSSVPLLDSEPQNSVAYDVDHSSDVDTSTNDTSSDISGDLSVSKMHDRGQILSESQILPSNFSSHTPYSQNTTNADKLPFSLSHQIHFQIPLAESQKKHKNTFFQSKKRILSSSKYTIFVDPLDNGMLIKKYSSNVSPSSVTLNAEDLPTPSNIVQQFADILRDLSISNTNFSLNPDEVSQKLSQIFDQVLFFEIPYQITGKQVYDANGKKITLQLRYHLPSQEFEFIGPIYDFIPAFADIPLLSFSPFDGVDSERIISLKKEEEIFVKIFYNGAFFFVPGTIYRSLDSDVYIFSHFGDENIFKKIQYGSQDSGGFPF